MCNFRGINLLCGCGKISEKQKAKRVNHPFYSLPFAQTKNSKDIKHEDSSS